MKRQVLRFGIAFAIINVVTIFITLWVMDSQRYQLADLLGYTAIVLAALLVFFGVRSYRQNHGGGRLAFGRGLAVGLAITLLACFVHVAVFEVVYFGFVPGWAKNTPTAWSSANVSPAPRPPNSSRPRATPRTSGSSSTSRCGTRP